MYAPHPSFKLTDGRAVSPPSRPEYLGHPLADLTSSSPYSSYARPTAHPGMSPPPTEYLADLQAAHAKASMAAAAAQQAQARTAASTAWWWQSYLASLQSQQMPSYHPGLPVGQSYLSPWMAHGMRLPPGGLQSQDMTPPHLMAGRTGFSPPRFSMGKKRDREMSLGVHSQAMKRNSRIKESKVCSNCGTSDTPFWRKDKVGGLPLCNACGLYYTKNNDQRPSVLWKHSVKAES